MAKEYFIAEQCDFGIRLDTYISDYFDDMSRSAVQKLLEKGCIKVNGKDVSKSYKIVGGEEIEVDIPEPCEPEITAENIPLDIVYEDEYMLVVNKPKGMTVHPAPGNYTGTLVNALLYHCGDSLSGINGVKRPGIVHRIDKDTTGLLLVAKCDMAHNCLAQQIKEHSLVREYEGIVFGKIKQESGTVDAPIGRHPKDRKKMAVTMQNSRNAVTHYFVVANYEGFTHMRFRLETGRTHQIRVHMQSLGHPIAGDAVYGVNDKSGLTTQCLHAKKVGFIHPKTEEYMEFEAPLPPEFQDFLTKLEAK